MAGIDFRGKGLVYSHHLTLPVRTIVTDAKRSLGKGSESGNLVIAGNQLDCLKALQSRYRGAIDVIYAVPPYNTGSDGWKYDDDIPAPLTQEWLKSGATSRDDPDRHDKWLSWMTPRLRLMHELLSEDGVLFISIDDNECHRLRMLLDEIFQEENALATLIWEKRYSPPSDVKDIGFVHENILVYRKSSAFKPALLPLTDDQVGRYKNPDMDLRGLWKPADYTCRFTKKERPNLFYPIVNPFTKKKVWPKPTRVWAYSEGETENNIRDKLLWWGKTGKNKVPALKNFVEGIQQGMVPVSLLSYADAGHTDQAAKELRTLLPDAKKDGKPLLLLKYLLDIAGKNGGVVFFPFPSAGEGPQSVFERNSLLSEIKKHSNFVTITSDAESEWLVTQRLRTLGESGLSVDFEYAQLGSAVDGDSLLKAKQLPEFSEIARHIFRSATGAILPQQPKASSTWLIGEKGGTDIHLVYKADPTFLRSDDAILDSGLATKIVAERKKGHSSVVFAAGKYLSHEDLVEMKIEFCPFPISIYRSSEK